MVYIEKKDFREEYRKKGDYHYQLSGFSDWFIRWNYRLLIHYLGRARTGRILDLACGDGLLEFINPSLRIVGADFSIDALAYARRKNAGGASRYTGVDMRFLPFAAGAFDGAMCSLSLQYLDREGLLECFSEVKRVLKPGGRFIFSYINPDYRLNAKHLDRLRSRNRQLQAVLTCDEITRCLAEAGWSLERIRGTNYPLDFSSIPAALQRFAFHASKIGFFFYRSAYHHVYVATAGK